MFILGRVGSIITMFLDTMTRVLPAKWVKLLFFSTKCLVLGCKSHWAKSPKYIISSNLLYGLHYNSISYRLLSLNPISSILEMTRS
jgi:hypothetical protein